MAFFCFLNPGGNGVTYTHLVYISHAHLTFHNMNKLCIYVGVPIKTVARRNIGVEPGLTEGVKPKYRTVKWTSISWIPKHFGTPRPVYL